MVQYGMTQAAIHAALMNGVRLLGWEGRIGVQDIAALQSFVMKGGAIHRYHLWRWAPSPLILYPRKTSMPKTP
jgi:hypothetical protein